MSISERLRIARERIGLTLQQVEEKAGIGKSSLSEFESGKREPRLQQLQTLADTYKQSVSYFLSKEPITATPVVLWREKPTSPEAEEIEATFLRLCNQFHNLELWCNDRRSWWLPEIQANPETLTYADVEILANAVRNELQLGERPGRSLLRILEEVCGLKVFYLDFHPRGTAASTLSETFGAAVLLNSQNPPRRRNFDLAHELFHLIVWRIFPKEKHQHALAAGNQEEKFATCFARNLLMPASVMRPLISKATHNNKISLDAVYDLARQFDVSVEAVLWNTMLLSRRSEEETKADIEKYKEAFAPLEDRDRTEPPKRPRRFEALAIKAIKQGEISLGRFAEYLGISRLQAQNLAEKVDLENGEVEITPP